MMSNCIILKELTNCFPERLLLCIFTRNAHSFQMPHNLVSTWYCQHFNFSHSRKYLIYIVIYISLVANYPKASSLCLLSIFLSFMEKCLFQYLSIVSWITSLTFNWNNSLYTYMYTCVCAFSIDYTHSFVKFIICIL